MVISSTRRAIDGLAALGAAAAVCVACGAATTTQTPAATRPADSVSPSKAPSSPPGIGSVSAEPAPTAPARTDCMPVASGPSSVEGIFAGLDGFTVKPGCPADMASPFTGADVKSVAAGVVSQNGHDVLTVFAAELNSETGAQFADTFVATMARDVTDPNKAVASDHQLLDGCQVTHFNSPASGEGYVYGQGPTAVIARIEVGAPPGAPKDAFTQLISHLR